MNSFFNEEEEFSEGEVIPDTPLPQDLHAHLEERKKQRKKIIVTTEKITTFTFAWSLNASGYLVARYLLITGGAINFGLALSLCFSISSVSSIVGLSGFRLGYQEGIEVENMQNAFRALGGLTVSIWVTYLAVNEYMDVRDATYRTAQEIQRGIDTIEGRHPQLDPWLTIAISFAIIAVTLSLVFRKR